MISCRETLRRINSIRIIRRDASYDLWITVTYFAISFDSGFSF